MVARIKAAIANHPQATAAGTTGGGTVLLLQIAARLGFHLSEFDAGLIVAFAAWLRFYVGRRGVIGAAAEAWHTFLRGSEGTS